MSFILFTDSNSDIPFGEVAAHDLKIVYMPYSLDGSDEVSDLGRGDVIPNFYAAMRAGKTPTTSLLTKEKYIESFEPYLQAGQDILFICFSSELSGTYNNAVLAQQELSAAYPERKLVVVNSRNVSMGEAYLAMEAAKLRDSGATLEETAQWVEAHKYNVRYWFTVDDLVYLKRGGRISKTTAAVGTLLNIKPMLTVTRSGKLISVDKQKGRRRAVHQLALNLQKEIVDPQNQVISILQADCMDDARALQAQIQELVPGATCRIEMVGPTICAHAGPGTRAVVFLGAERERE